jgi:hypothetical protein
MQAIPKNAILLLLYIWVHGSFAAAHPLPPPIILRLANSWKFATDPGDQGMAKYWYAENFDDSAWKTLWSGLSWEQQGVDHQGFGWYRQKLIIPQDYQGTALVFTLAVLPSDDDVFVNGVRVGGIKGEYKYANMLQRVYTVPPTVLRYGQPNTIAIRVWGGNLTFIGSKSGLVAGPYTAELSPYRVAAREQGGDESTERNIELLDLSEAQRGKPFELVFCFPNEILNHGAGQMRYILSDYYGEPIISGEAPINVGKDGIGRGVVTIDNAMSQTIYLRGRFKAELIVSDNGGDLLYWNSIDIDHLSFSVRDSQPLPPLPDAEEETPYGRLKLVDEIDCSRSLAEEPHPYLESGFDKAQMFKTPGSSVKVSVNEILGKKARESESGWFAYRIGRGKLRPHTTYLLRIEYPEDKPRLAPIEVQVGQNFMDIGWKNGVGANDPYDNWPLSETWQWYDAIVPLDDATVGAGGTGSASAENGFWVYFMNKVFPQKYNSLYEGGPAIARIKLFEISPDRNAPVINKPKNLPQRVLMFDWERQPDHQPADLVGYAKLMGYSGISPVILKWGFANYSEPLNGYNSVNVDARHYWVTRPYQPQAHENAGPALEGIDSVHVKYLAATRNSGVDYIPRIEYGGSLDLPVEARAIAGDGKPAKPKRYASWCADLLHPATWDDFAKLIEHLVKPYVSDNPQLSGILWRSRSNRMPISFSRFDINLFANETKSDSPYGSAAELAAWASTGPGKTQYGNWWHQKREEFQSKLLDLLKSYRSTMTLYYYNWDEDKFSLVLPDTNSWAFLSQVVSAKDGSRAVYEKDRNERRAIRDDDYVNIIHAGNFGKASGGINRPDYGLHTELYQNTKGIRLFAPAGSLYLANSPKYLNYFRTADGLSVSNMVSYDEVASRTINPKYEGSMLTPAGPAFSMALELLAYFHGDARTLTYTAYTYGRGFADAHRRFAQAFLALPAIDGETVDEPDPDLKVRLYRSANGIYVGVAYRGYAPKKLTLALPATLKSNATVKNLVNGEAIPAVITGRELQFDLESGPMELNAFLIQ